jgi:hypothetical protein
MFTPRYKNALYLFEIQGVKCNFCDPAGIRTQDPYIKSVMLYQLSYGIKLFFVFLEYPTKFGTAKVKPIL